MYITKCDSCEEVIPPEHEGKYGATKFVYKIGSARRTLEVSVAQENPSDGNKKIALNLCRECIVKIVSAPGAGLAI